MIVRAATMLLALALLAGCDSENGSNERRGLREEDAPVARAIVREDIQSAQSGVRQVAERMERGFLVEDHERRAREMRSYLRRLQEPPRGIPELIVSPTTFVATVDTDGKVICRDVDPDPMAGFDIGAIAPVVRRALREGEAGYELVQIPSADPDEQPSTTILFAHPSMREGRVVGAVIAGLPLWRLGQQITRQVQLENAASVSAGALYWTLLYRGDDLHYHAGFPPDLRGAVPSAAQRRSALEGRTGGYTGEFQIFGRWYGYAVVPLPSIGEDVGLVMFRSDPV